MAVDYGFEGGSSYGVTQLLGSGVDARRRRCYRGRGAGFRGALERARRDEDEDVIEARFTDLGLEADGRAFARVVRDGNDLHVELRRPNGHVIGPEQSPLIIAGGI